MRGGLEVGAGGGGLAAVVAARGWAATAEIPFYWVVPDDVYGNFVGGGFELSEEEVAAAGRAGQHRKRLTEAETAAHPVASRVVQYVLRIPPFAGRGGGAPDSE